jgi:hypothetical protein
MVLLGTGMMYGQSADGNILRQLSNGEWWTGLPAHAKVNFVEGYTAAMTRANQVTHSLCTNNAKNAPTDGQLNATPAMDLCVIAESFDFNLDRHNLVHGIDEFYKDSRNTRIPIDSAIEYVRDKLRSKKSAKELEDELTRWRNIVNK